MKKQLLLILSLLAINFIIEPCSQEHKQKLKSILEYYNQEIANIKRPALNGKSYRQIEDAPDLNYFSLSQKYTLDEILKKLTFIERFFIEKLDNSLESRALATQQANEDGFLDISGPQSDFTKGLHQKIKEVQFMIDLLKAIYQECPELVTLTWYELAQRKLGLLNS